MPSTALHLFNSGSFNDEAKDVDTNPDEVSAKAKVDIRDRINFFMGKILGFNSFFASSNRYTIT